MKKLRIHSQSINIKKVYGSPKGEWGIYFVIQSDYTHIKGYNTVISATISKLNTKSNTTNKTADQTTSVSELKKETFNQLKKVLTDLLVPDFSILNKNVYREEDKWKTTDSSFLIVPSKKGKKDFLDYILKENVYTIGTHTGKSYYKATSIETAITNSVNIINILEPETKKYFVAKRGFYLKDLLLILFLILFVGVFS